MNLSIVRRMILIMLTIFLGCEGHGPNKEVKLVGINGEALYHLDYSSGEVVLVAKEDYLKLGDYIITIKKDTLKVGDSFEARFNIYHQNYSIVIKEPRTDTIIGSFENSSSEIASESDVYVYQLDREGIFNFRGQIEYDTMVFPFEYKFVVYP